MKFSDIIHLMQTDGHWRVIARRFHLPIAFGMFLAFYLLLFMQFPFGHSLTGDLDTLANLAMYKEAALWWRCLWSGETYTTLCYPVSDFWMHMGADFGIGVIHLFFNALGFDDLWANFLFMSVLFSLNATALYSLMRYMFGSVWIGLTGALMFNTAHFTLANMENPNTLVFFFSFASLMFLLRYLDPPAGKRRGVLLFLSILPGGLQIYFAPYNFLLHAMILGCFLLWFLYRRTIRWKEIATMAAGYFVFAFPYLKMFVFGQDIDNSYNVVIEQGALHALSMNLEDYLRVMPHHWYMKYVPFIEFPWIIRIKSAFPGILFYLLVFTGIFYRSRYRPIAVALLFTGVIVATGPQVCHHFKPLFPAPMYPFYEWFDFGSILRIPIRAFFIALFGGILLVGSTMQRLGRLLPLPLIALLFGGFFLLENIPRPMEKYSYDIESGRSPEFIAALQQGEPKVVVHLPSELFIYRADRREYLYMYWHHLYNDNTINGYLGFIPEPRLRTNELLSRNDPASLDTLVRDFGVERIVFHKDLVLKEEEWILLEYLSASESFRPVFESEEKVIYDQRPVGLYEGS